MVATTMRARPPGGSIGAMGTTSEIVVAIEPGAALRGSVGCESGNRPFIGWLGLLSALQEAIGELGGAE